jgi:nitrite reductase/ring-hydroxylating ferredoxin subunit
MSAQPLKLVKLGSEETLMREGKGTVVRAEGLALALFKVEGRCYALANACPHRGGPLGEGELHGHVVTCPWHGWTWDVRTGANARNPALKKVACFPVSVVEGEVFIELP